MLAQESTLTSPSRIAFDLLEPLAAYDRSSYDHCFAVGRLSARLARALGRNDVDFIGEVGTLHDVGKIETPLEILNSTVRLSEAELVVMRSHAVASERIVRAAAYEPADADALALAVRAHHERFDGFGYPDGLVGEAIPYASRVVAVADTFDALTRGRPYRDAVSINRALMIIFVGRTSGHFDPTIAQAFLTLVAAEGI